MTVYCKIENGVVTERLVFDAAPPADWPGLLVPSDVAQIGWGYDGANLIPPVISVPQQTAEQLRIAALKANARTQAIVAALTTKDDVGLIAAVTARYPGLTGDGLKAVTDIALALATIYRG